MYANTSSSKQAPARGNAVANNVATQAVSNGQKDMQPAGSAEQNIQEMVNNSSQVNQLRAVQAMANDKDAGPVPKKQNNTGLPNHLKSGIEGLSGLSMDDVKVHYNSGQPAQLNALAYAQGTDIHLAAGQEKHLPHEAWHVVQQKQGRVQATRQMKGDTALNDDKGLEQEADIMGAKAAAFNEQGSVALFAKAPAAASAQLKVVQRLSTQIVINEDDKERRIVHLVVRGRPPRAHKGRMGDHSTAFIVQVEGLNIMLRGLTVRQAIEALQDLDRHIWSLPGMQVANVDDVNREVKEFNRNIARATIGNYTGNEDLAIHHLQLALNAYLRARELVPFSTINVAYISQGLAGKGHGESGPASVLSGFERGEIKEIPDEKLVEAIEGLFDPQAAGMVAIEMEQGNVDGLLGRPAKLSGKGSKERVKPIWQQHLLSVKKMFPKCYERVADKLSIDKLEEKMRDMDYNNMIYSLAQAKLKLGELEKEVQNEKLYFSGDLKLTSNKGMFVFEKLKRLAALYRKVATVQQLLPGLWRLNYRLWDQWGKEILEIQKRLTLVKKDISSHLPEYDKKKDEKAVTKTSEHVTGMISKHTVKEKEKVKKTKTSHHTNFSNLKKVVGGMPSSPVLPQVYDSPVHKPFPDEEDEVDILDIKPMETSGEHILDFPEEEIDDTEEQEEEYQEPVAPPGTITRETSPMANQLLLVSDKGGARITGLLSSGRPASPFTNTMGAHSTAWIVHLDRVRRRLMGKTLNEAAEEMRLMIKETLNLYELLKGGSWGDNAKLLIKGAWEAINNAAIDKGKDATITQVQHMITCTLSFLNLLPTISQDSTRTTGNSEGNWRAILRDFEYEDKGTQEQVQQAIIKLYDDKGAKAWDRHENFIAQAYPRAAAFAKTGKAPLMSKELSAQKPQSNDVEDSGGSGSVKTLTEFDLEALHSEDYKKNYLNPDVLAGINNCLFNAIADAAGIKRPTVDQVIRIREILNVPLGEMLTATRERLDVILLILGLQDRGAIVFYNHDEWMDTSTVVSEDALMIQHDGVNHFTAAHEFMAHGGLEGSGDNIKKESGDKKRTLF